MKIFDYNLPENNCFTIKHSAKNYVESCIVDNNTLTINYNDNVKQIPIEKEIFIDIYNKFGIFIETLNYVVIDVIDKTNTSITYRIE